MASTLPQKWQIVRHQNRHLHGSVRRCANEGNGESLRPLGAAQGYA
jgi:hypothetical protein